MIKEKFRIPNPTVSPQIPPNIPNMVEKSINNQQETVLSKEQDKIPINVEQSTPVDKEPPIIINHHWSFLVFIDHLGNLQRKFQNMLRKGNIVEL